MLINISQQEDPCHNINISSNNTVLDDIVKEGITQFKWSKFAVNPIIIDSSKKEDYIYVFIQNEEGDHSNSILLNYTNKHQANSSIFVSRQFKKYSFTEYSVRINYNCNPNGGAMLDYSLKIKVEGCNNVEIHWKKICGSTSLQREGVMIIMQSINTNITLIDNGKLIDNIRQQNNQQTQQKTILIKENEKNTSLYIYQKQIKKPNVTGSLVSVIGDMINEYPYTKVSKVDVDTDRSQLVINLQTELEKGGQIDQNIQAIHIDYHCLVNKVSPLVELTIRLDYFQDISLVFQKECSVKQKYGLIQIIIILGLLFTLSYFSLYYINLINVYLNSPSLQRLVGLLNFFSFYHQFNTIKYQHQRALQQQNQTLIIEEKKTQLGEEGESLISR